MKAALVQTDHTLRVQEIPCPEAGPGELLIEVAYCGVCGTDVHMLRAGLFPAGSIIGHEISGYVAKAGPGVEGWTEGDRVVVLPIDPCLSCEACRQGDTNLCEDSLVRTHGMGINPGGFCQYLRVRPSALFRVPDGVDLKAAALAEPFAVAVRAVGLSAIPAGAPAVVMGAGPVGLLTVYALKAAGAGQICVTELDPWRAQRAWRAGADLVLDPRVQNPRHEMAQRTGRPPRHVFDCAGTDSSMEQAGGIVGRHGRVVVVGIHFGGGVTLVPMTWFLKETTVHFSLGYNLKEFSDSLALLGKGSVDAEVLISDVLPLGRIGEAFELLLTSGHARILIDCRDA
jgi:(R,R)-butanediol dehydrogenase/meso-butanediol dehydrogenase/diacetyl reductase